MLYDAWFDSGHMGTRQSREPSDNSRYFLREGRPRILSPEMYRKVESVWAMTSEKCLRVLRYPWPLWLQFTQQSTEAKKKSHPYVKVDSGPCRRSFRGSDAHVFVAECELLCALQACFKGVQASCLKSTSLFLSTGNFNMRFGPYEEIGEQCVLWKHCMDPLTTTPIWPAQRAWNAGKWTTLCEIRLPCWSQSIRVDFRPLAKFYLRGHPSFEVSYSFPDQLLAQLDILRYWKVNEGLQENILRYTNSFVTHDAVPAQHQLPLIHGGVPFALPAPTNSIRFLRLRNLTFETALSGSGTNCIVVRGLRNAVLQ